MSTAQFDVVVIGAGAGGLFTAARLAHRGYRTLVVERLDKVGGRASTDDIDGFKVNNGAIVVEVGGITQQTCEEVGAPFEIREPNPPLLYRIGGKDVDVTGGGWGLLLGKLTRQGAKLVKGIGAARNDSGLPEDEISTADWVSRYTKNERVHGIFRNMCASIFAVGSEDLPARVSPTSPARARSNDSGSTRKAPSGCGEVWRRRSNHTGVRCGCPRRSSRLSPTAPQSLGCR
jgi:phytoene desaturase